MDIKTYTEQAKRTTASMGTYLMDNFHYLSGMVTEIGELMDPFKKNLAYGKRIDMVNVQEEVGDLMWYLANFCRINSIDLEEVMEQNIAKLRARYPDKFDADKAINRDLDAERKVLEAHG
jgi:NTP pyrophosphatase (non-canonical NTP hydrolase)